MKFPEEDCDVTVYVNQNGTHNQGSIKKLLIGQRRTSNWSDRVDSETKKKKKYTYVTKKRSVFVT